MESNSIKETLRLEAFSDGVFGFAITLLVLDIHVPVLKEDKTLLGNLPRFPDWFFHHSNLLDQPSFHAGLHLQK
jgi:uncharacterized membrane protein